MTDTSLFTPEAEPATSELVVPSAFDTSRFDANIQRISAVERTWGRPELPDEVKFDLANLDGVDDVGLFSFLTGLDEELAAIEDEEEVPSFDWRDPPDISLRDRVSSIVAGLQMRPAPEEVTTDAVRKFKYDAINRGLLDMDPSRVDDSWGPEFNRIRGEMAFDIYNERSAGENRAGAMPLKGVMDLLNDFTSPAGLLSAATQLDLWWDFGAIGREASSWGDKWRKLGESDGILDFGKNLIDALTGPIDDIVMPALNIGLMAVGLGAAANTARIAWMGRRGLTALEAVRNIYRVPQGVALGGRAARTLGNFQELGRASSLATRFQRYGSTRSLGSAMERWRANLAVKGAKGVIQPGMRLGFVNELEERLPGYQGGGFDLAELPGVDEVSERLYAAGQSPILAIPEVMIAPYNIFRPGTFLQKAGHDIGALTRAGRGVRLAAGSAPGRAVIGAGAGAAIGAVAGDDAGDIGRGALAGAAGLAGAPVAGKILQNPAGRMAVGAAAGAAVGNYLGDDPEDILMGAVTGAGVFAVPASVRAAWRKAKGLPESGIAVFNTGALNKTLHGLGRGMEMLSFRPLTEREELSYAFDRGMRASMQNAIDVATDDEKIRIENLLNQWESDVRGSGVHAALARLQGTDVETAATSIAWTYASAMVDHISTAQALPLGGAKGARLLARNKLTSQLRAFDEVAIAAGDDTALNDLAWAIAWTEKAGKNPSRNKVAKRAVKIRGELEADLENAVVIAKDHNEKAVDTLHQLFSTQNLPDLDGDLMQSRTLIGGREFASTKFRARASVMEAYMPQMWDTYGRWEEFSRLVEDLNQVRSRGLFDLAELTPGVGRSGKTVGTVTSPPLRERVSAVEEANRVISTAILNGGKAGLSPEALARAQITIAAPAVLPGKLTFGLKSTKFRAELFSKAEEIRDHLAARKALEGAHRGLKGFKAGDLKALEGADLRAAEVKALLRQVPGRKDVEYLVRYAQRRGLSLEDVAAGVEKNLADLDADVDTWRAFGLPDHMLDDRGARLVDPAASLAARAKHLDDEMRWAAAEVDTGKLVADLRAVNPDSADELEAFLKAADDAGYKVVHGTEFLSTEDLPADVMKLPFFGDATQRHINFMTLGNFFRGKLPLEARIARDIRHRGAIVGELAKIGRDIAPEDENVSQALRVLRTWLEEAQDGAAMGREDHMGVGEKLAARIRSSTVPVSLDDIPASKKKAIVEALEDAGWTDKEATAIWKATMQFRNTSFRDLGLAAFEQKLRTQNQLAEGLKLLGSTKYWQLRGGAGVFTGAAVGAYQARDSEEGQRGGAITGALLGGTLGAVGLRPIAAKRVLDWAEANRYGYMADRIARVRDALRFTLSPFFDASRYTEGLMLGQTGAPLRRADGSRIVLPLNMSPSALRRQYRKAGMSESAARVKYAEGLEKFKAAARGRRDFDPDAIDETGKWFRQVGILGFSPTDWMGTAYARLLDEGLDELEAYDAVRSMYTYGTRARSAAEMSVNTILFPFSFQKKAYTHLAKWMNDDLGRSILIHDALKAYELLDERFNLDNMWRDHVPGLRLLNRLNLFAYGLSPGVLGGINKNLFDSGKLAWNLFVPVGLRVGDKGEGKQVQDVFRRLMPAVNDINWMMHDLQDTRHVIFSDEHVTRRAEVSRGWNRWNEEREVFEAKLEREGLTLEDVLSADNDGGKYWLLPLLAEYNEMKVGLEERFPEWKASRDENALDYPALAQEANDRRNRAQVAIGRGLTPSMDDMMYVEFADRVEELRYRIELRTGRRNMEDLSSDMFRQVHEIAAEMARRNPGFRGIYKKFFENQFGPIVVPI